MDGIAMVAHAFQDQTNYRIYMKLKKELFFLKYMIFPHKQKKARKSRGAGAGCIKFLSFRVDSLSGR